jgi:hypothetical protein
VRDNSGMSVNEESTPLEQATRCSLVSVSTMAGVTYSEAKAFNFYNFKPSLAIDVGKDTISVVDLNTNALVASAPLAQVTATPAKNEIKLPRLGVIALPILVVCIPGVQRLTIGCMDGVTRFGQIGYRYSWRDTVPQDKEPAYYVSGTGLSTLAEKFGLSPQLEDSHPAGPSPWYQQPRGQKILRRMVIGGLVFGVVACVVIPICIAIVSHILR